MSIFLAIIALQLVNISGKLDQSGRLDGDVRACTKWVASFDKGTIEQEKRDKKSAGEKIGIPRNLVRAYCNSLARY